MGSRERDTATRLIFFGGFVRNPHGQLLATPKNENHLQGRAAGSLLWGDFQGKSSKFRVDGRCALRPITPIPIGRPVAAMPGA